MVALHARRSYDSIRRFHDKSARKPLIVVLTGTDLYRDIHSDPDAQDSLALAVRLAAKASLVAEIAWEWFVSIF